MTKTVKQHEDKFIRLPKSWGQVLMLLGLYTISGLAIYGILSQIAGHNELDTLTVFNFFSCLGFYLPVWLIWGGNLYITIKVQGKNSLLQLPLLLLLLPLPLLPLPLLQLPLLLLLLPLLLLSNE